MIVPSPPPPTTYAKLTSGTCESSGYPTITDGASCRAAADQYAVDGDTFNVAPDTGCPSGCPYGCAYFVRTPPDSNVFLNNVNPVLEGTACTSSAQSVPRAAIAAAVECPVNHMCMCACVGMVKGSRPAGDLLGFLNFQEYVPCCEP